MFPIHRVFLALKTVLDRETVWAAKKLHEKTRQYWTYLQPLVAKDERRSSPDRQCHFERSEAGD